MIDVVILTHIPDEKLKKNILMLQAQTKKPEHIFIVNTDESQFKLDLVLTNDENKNILVTHISKPEFDHGRTRNMMAKQSHSEYLLYMTQDAICMDKYVLENLLKGFSVSENIAVVYARQIPRDGGLIEEWTRKYNYPEYDILKDKSTKELYGIKNIFLSNVCAMYDKNIFDKLSGFTENINFNEDTLYAHKAIENGYKILYKSDAKVFHTHDYTAKEQYKRNYQIGISHKVHKDVFGSYKTVSEGKKLVIGTAKFILTANISSLEKLKELFKLFVISAAKYLGFKCGYSSCRNK